MRPPTQTHRPREGHGVHSILTSGIQTLALSIIVCAIIWKHARTFQATPPAVSNDPVDDALPPDLVRLGKPVPSEALKCGVAIPPESIVTTRHGQFSVVVFGRAWSLGSVDGRQFAWSYEVELANEGSDSIQLMTRHMVITRPGASCPPRRTSARTRGEEGSPTGRTKGGGWERGGVGKGAVV